MSTGDLLSQVPIFKTLTKPTLKKISAVIETVNFTDGALIFSEGSPGDALYIVAEGEVLILKLFSKGRSKEHNQKPEDREKVITTLQKGDFFGEMALLDETPRSASARAKGDATLLKLEKKLFWKFVKEHAPEALQTIILLSRTMSDRLRQTTLELAIVYELGKIFSSGLNRNNLIPPVTEQIKNILPEGSAASLYFWNEFNEEFDWGGSTHPEMLPAELKRNMARSEPIPKFLEDQRSLFLADNLEDESRLLEKEKNLYGGAKGSFLMIPLFKAQDVQLLPSGHWIASCPLLGFICCFHPEKKAAFDRNRIHLLKTVSHLFSTALENSIHRDEEAARTRYAQQRQSVY